MWNFHAREACSAMGKTCRKCGKANHFARIRMSGSKRIHKVSETSLQTGDSLFVETISGDIRSSNQVFVDIEVGQYNEEVSFKLDTGVQVNVIPLELFLKLKCDNLEETTLCGYGGKPLKVEGKCALSCQYKQRKKILEFCVVSTLAPPVLGLTSCLSLRLINLILSVEEMQNPGQNQNDMLKEYSDVLEGLGTFLGVHKIRLEPDAVPVIHPHVESQWHSETD